MAREQLTVWGIGTYKGAVPIRVMTGGRGAADRRISELKRSGWTGVLSGPPGMSYNQIISAKTRNVTAVQVAALRGDRSVSLVTRAPSASTVTAARTAGS